ncbi:putative endopeptidase precursor [Streptomyces sp. YIM 130001]|uniref:C40 family peptidase n=1 Tax=Streptomyces sp. YIM 130001 TaxID=2259644 RepID=UPI000E65E712|nr:C40 family peptidase [Streptomyces sp. YIM 130001]RII13823.1 putative endopeptidase precursor [Streptomyces sp. YIM 130001]
MTAAALLCAATVLAASGPASADPRTRPVAEPEPRTPATPKTLADIHKEVERLYHQAAVATDAYNLAEEKADKQSTEIVRLAKDLEKGRKKLSGLKQRAGAAARAQYRGGGMPPQAQLMLSDDPQKYIESADRLHQGQKATKGLLGELTRTQQDLESYAKSATEQWKKLEANRKKRAKAKKRIKERIAAAEKLESKLAADERKRLRKLEENAQLEAQTAWLDSGILKEIDGRATAAGKKAIEYATGQIGKPYVWGAEGPDSFDCSGLTSQAWVAGGRVIPRTSQEQWKQLPRIDIKDMRPGDLIIYQKDASHVGLYIGEGAMVHAPRPGRDVTMAGAGSMPILGVVRPDK